MPLIPLNKDIVELRKISKQLQNNHLNVLETPVCRRNQMQIQRRFPVMCTTGSNTVNEGKSRAAVLRSD
ncbi:hypothetical protein Y032_0612g668 [Ancylostoma ceylanicum]|nr:hypothetical protein Y032_0612g668 [Ancylostoma ceylanicum]